MGVRLLSGKKVDWEQIAVTQWEPYEQGELPATSDALEKLAAFLIESGADRIRARTQILIAPGYEFRVVSGLVTNFHQPQSTLLVLIAALIGEKWKEVYQYALDHDFRFLSYGDGSLLLRNTS